MYSTVNQHIQWKDKRYEYKVWETMQTSTGRVFCWALKNDKKFIVPFINLMKAGTIL